MPMLGGFAGADVNGPHPTYRLAGKLKMLTNGIAIAQDDADFVQAEKLGLVIWDGARWTIAEGVKL